MAWGIPHCNSWCWVPFTARGEYLVQQAMEGGRHIKLEDFSRPDIVQLPFSMALGNLDLEYLMQEPRNLSSRQWMGVPKWRSSLAPAPRLRRKLQRRRWRS